MEIHLKLAGFIEVKEEAKLDLTNVVTQTNSKMDVSQPKVLEFNSTQKKPENATSSFLPPIKIKLNNSQIADTSVKSGSSMLKHHIKSPSLKMKESLIVESNEKSNDKTMAISIQ